MDLFGCSANVVRLCLSVGECSGKISYSPVSRVKEANRMSMTLGSSQALEKSCQLTAMQKNSITQVQTETRRVENSNSNSEIRSRNLPHEL